MPVHVLVRWPGGPTGLRAWPRTLDPMREFVVWGAEPERFFEEGIRHVHHPDPDVRWFAERMCWEAWTLVRTSCRTTSV